MTEPEPDPTDDYELGANRYGKSRIRLVTVRRDPDRHHLRDLTVAVALEGDFDAVHIRGDNAGVIATDTMKNTVYAFARDRLIGSPEAFGLELARHFAAYDACSRAIIDIEEQRWLRIPEDGGEAPDAFVRAGDLTRLAHVAVDKAGAVEVEAGVGDLTVMKTAKSAFTGFDRDRYTTLPEVEDRLIGRRGECRVRETDPQHDQERKQEKDGEPQVGDDDGQPPAG